jgi:hypothetical protein
MPRVAVRGGSRARALRGVAKGAAIAAVLVATKPLVELGDRHDALEMGAAPAAVALILLFRWLGPGAERAGWAAFLVLVGFTYVWPAESADSTWLLVERAGLAVCIAVALSGLAFSPWFLSAGFLAHAAWDLVEHDVTGLPAGLPLSCLIFDLIVAAYLATQCRAQRWRPAVQLRRREATTDTRFWWS